MNPFASVSIMRHVGIPENASALNRSFIKFCFVVIPCIDLFQMYFGSEANHPEIRKFSSCLKKSLTDHLPAANVLRIGLPIKSQHRYSESVSLRR
jgi:hypothetical protein